ncbi:hypothetical protein D3C81_1840380 [compost metagenome]
MVVSSACMTTASTTQNVINTRSGEGGSGPVTSFMMEGEQGGQRFRQATGFAGIDVDHGAHAMAQCWFAGGVVDPDVYRNALHDLHPIARRVLRRQQRETGAGSRADTIDGAMPGHTGVSVHLDGDPLADPGVGQFCLFWRGGHPQVFAGDQAES